MPTLSQAPLIEAIFELRWGEVQRDPDSDSIRFKYPERELEIIESHFKSLIGKHGFPVVEEINPDLKLLPHVVSRRYRKEPNGWPCYQTGMGIFTANQINEDYNWSTFKKDILLGLKALDEALPTSLVSLPKVGVELRYQDGFALDDNETGGEFLKSKMALEFKLPGEFLSSEVISNEAKATKIEFHLVTSQPKGVFINNLDYANINGRPGFVMSSIVRSADKNTPDFKLSLLDKWLDESHVIQRHAFETLINQAFARTFQ